jgi:hypothetical protein
MKLYVRIFLGFILNFNFQVITQGAKKECIFSHLMLMEDVYPETLFDFDLGQKLLESGFQESMAWIYEDSAYQLLAKYPNFKDIIKNEDDYDFLVAFIVNFMFIHKRNSSKVMRGGKVDGAGIQLFGSLLNHSCDPNVTNVSMDNKFAIVVTKPMVTYTASTGICHRSNANFNIGDFSSVETRQLQLLIDFSDRDFLACLALRSHVKDVSAWQPIQITVDVLKANCYGIGGGFVVNTRYCHGFKR